jgi:hypothetical protein
MADELMVILGVEITMLIFVATMSLREKRMDVLSGRFFERGATGKPPPIWVQTCRGTVECEPMGREFHRSIFRG